MLKDRHINPALKNLVPKNPALKFIAFFTAILSLSVFLPFASYAQTVSIPGQIPELEEQVYVNMSPKTPKAGEKLTISLEAYGTDLNKADITWQVNGEVAKKGTGEAVFETTAPTAGKTMTIKVAVVVPDGAIIIKTVTVSPQSVDLLWESPTYTPPFYKGKALYAPQEKVLLVAMPQFINTSGAVIDPKTLSYKWSKNSTVIGDASGRGRQTFSFTGTILMTPTKIDLEVTGPDNATAQAQVTISPVLPSAYFYEDHPVYGVLFNSAVSFLAFSTGEKTLAAYPYFFGAKSKSDPNLSYSWTMNNEKLNFPTSQNTMVFRNQDNLEGEAVVSVRVTNLKNFLQESRAQASLSFTSLRNSVSF